MQQKLLKMLAIAALSSTPLIANDIEPGKEFYTAPFTLTPIVLDGKLDEWSGVSPLVDPKFSIPKGSGDGGTLVLFEEYAGGTWSGPNDQTSAVQVAYDADNVYFGFVVTDDYHENSANSAWNGDSVQLMIANADRNAQVALYNYALGGIEAELGEVIVMHEAGPGGTEAIVTRDGTNKKTYYEIKLPASALGLTAPLTAGTKFGLGMAINDGDDGEGQAGQKGWGGLGAHSIVFGKTPGETALVTLGASTTTIEVLGTGTDALLGGDLTDPENDGDEGAGANHSSWNWAGITSSIEPGFDGAENSFNVFDNKLGPGNDKWCCDDPSPTNPHWIAVQFPNPVSLTHFTVSSANDVPDRDPIRWQIQGSNDGQNYTPIFIQNADTALWTERLQVIKFTLPVPSAPFRFIRYFVTETPGPLHQVGEIEYFGTFGTSALAYLSAINPQITRFSFRVTDAGASTVDPASVKLIIDGQQVTIPTPTKVAGAIDVVYTPTAVFPPNSEHSYSIEAKDTLGNTISSTGTWRTQNYGLLKSEYRVTADTTKRGFVWNIFQNAGNQDNSNARSEDQLAGRTTLPNHADPNAQSTALAVGVAGPNGTVGFEIEGVINFNQDAPGAAGGFNTNNGFEDQQIPGIPGIEGSTDGIAAEAITYIDLPQGLWTMGVNSDDGFRVTAGRVRDALGALFLGEFNGGRGAADTLFPLYVEEAGVYEFRMTWQEGGGGANVEWFIVKADGTRALINDSENGGPRAYRARSGASASVIARRAVPTPGQTGVSPDVAITVELVDAAGAAVEANSVTVKIDGATVTPNVTKAAEITTVVVPSSGLFPPNSSHTVELGFNAGGPQTRTWSFTVANYFTLSTSIGTTPGSGTTRGFRIRTVQSDAGRNNADVDAERQLLDNFGNDNVADLTGFGADGYLNFDGVINFNQDAPGAVGNFNADNGNEDQPVPGIPGVNGSTDNFSQEILAFLDLPKGVIRMGVNSDDGFKVIPGSAADSSAPVLGIFNGGRGASDTIFSFVTPAAGVYPLRLIWYEGGGGANAEWFTVANDGSKILINSAAAGAVRAYRARNNTPLPTETGRFTAIRIQGGNIVIEWSGAGTLQRATSITGPWTDVAGATSPRTIPLEGSGAFWRLRQ